MDQSSVDYLDPNRFTLADYDYNSERNSTSIDASRDDQSHSPHLSYPAPSQQSQDLLLGNQMSEPIMASSSKTPYLAPEEASSSRTLRLHRPNKSPALKKSQSSHNESPLSSNQGHDALSDNSHTTYMTPVTPVTASSMSRSFKSAPSFNQPSSSSSRQYDQYDLPTSHSQAFPPEKSPGGVAFHSPFSQQEHISRYQVGSRPRIDLVDEPTTPIQSLSSHRSNLTYDHSMPYHNNELHPLPSIPRSYSSRRAFQDGSTGYPPQPESDDVGPLDGPAVNGNETEEKIRPDMARNFTSRSQASVPWWRNIFPASLACKLLLLTVVLELVVDLTIEANILWRFNNEVKSDSSTALEIENKRRLPIYLIIYGLAHLWELVLTIIAIRSRNTVQVVAVTAFNFAILGYAVVQIYELRSILGDNLTTSLETPGGSFDQPKNKHSQDNGGGTDLLSLPLNVLTAVVIAVVAVASVILVVLAWFIRRDFGWERYRFLGADLSIRKYYFRFQIFECIVYFSAFFCAGFGIQFIWLVLQKTDVEYIITWIMFPLSIIFLIIGRFAAKYENKYVMAGFMIGLVAGCAYFIFKLFRIWEQSTTTYENVALSLTVFDALSLCLLIACFIFGLVCWTHFNKGLKEAVLDQPNSSILSSLFGLRRTKSSEPRQEGIDMSQRRISIV